MPAGVALHVRAAAARRRPRPAPRPRRLGRAHGGARRPAAAACRRRGRFQGRGAITASPRGSGDEGDTGPPLGSGQAHAPRGCGAATLRRGAACGARRRSMSRITVTVCSCGSAASRRCLILIAAAGFWRLLQGPVELDRLVPYVEQALQRSGAGIGVAVTGVSIGIDPPTHISSTCASKDVQLVAAERRKARQFSRDGDELQPRRHAQGPPRTHPPRCRAPGAGAEPRRRRRAEPARRQSRPGRSGEPGCENALALFAPLAAGHAVEPAAPDHDPRRDNPRRRQGERESVARRPRRGDAAAQRRGRRRRLSFAVALGSNTTELHATYRYAAPAHQLDVGLSVAGLDPAALAPLSPAFAPLAKARFPVSGSADIRLDAGHRHGRGRTPRPRLRCGPDRHRSAGRRPAAGGARRAARRLRARHRRAAARTPGARPA